MKDPPSQRLLSALAREARRAKAPDLDWNRVEQRLFAEIDRGDKAEIAVAKPSARRVSAWWLLPAAAAFAFLGLHKPAQPPTVSPPVMAARTSLDGDGLGTSLLEAKDQPLIVEHPGRASWTLSAHSQARVLGHADVIRVQLLAGALEARVVPTREPERFVVEVADTRVAVHGTVFRVTRDGERNVVDVEEGIVAVGPLARGTAAPTLLRAPTHGEFTLAGAPIEKAAQGDAEVTTPAGVAVSHHGKRLPTAEGSSPQDAPASPDASVTQSAAPAEASANPHIAQTLTIGEVESGVSSVVATVNACFRESTAGSRDLRVVAHSTISLDVLPNGGVANVDFTPPLAPAVLLCSKPKLLELRFPASVEGAKIVRHLELTR
jgi:ferric-dicitrate binding protein FerR (iron transport regulator)